jgi:hypothetical protein
MGQLRARGCRRDDRLLSAAPSCDRAFWTSRHGRHRALVASLWPTPLHPVECPISASGDCAADYCFRSSRQPASGERFGERALVPRPIRSGVALRSDFGRAEGGAHRRPQTAPIRLKESCRRRGCSRCRAVGPSWPPTSLPDLGEAGARGGRERMRTARPKPARNREYTKCLLADGQQARQPPMRPEAALVSSSADMLRPSTAVGVCFVAPRAPCAQRRVGSS